MDELYHKLLTEALANLTEEIKMLKAEVKELKERDCHYAPLSGWRRDRPNKLK